MRCNWILKKTKTLKKNECHILSPPSRTYASGVAILARRNRESAIRKVRKERFEVNLNECIRMDCRISTCSFRRSGSSVGKGVKFFLSN